LPYLLLLAGNVFVQRFGWGFWRCKSDVEHLC
jgi:hypothetical protein